MARGSCLGNIICVAPPSALIINSRARPKGRCAMDVNPKRVLWPTDFSELSMRGGRYARGFCEHFNAELHIIHVIPPPLSPDVTLVVPAEVPVSVSEPEIVDASQEALNKLVSENFAGFEKVVAKVFFGNPWPGRVRIRERTRYRSDHRHYARTNRPQSCSDRKYRRTNRPARALSGAGDQTRRERTSSRNKAT